MAPRFYTGKPVRMVNSLISDNLFRVMEPEH
jgi:hypothetical protein